MDHDSKKPIVILDHDPVPPYKRIFYTATVLGTLYMLLILFASGGGHAGH